MTERLLNVAFKKKSKSSQNQTQLSDQSPLVLLAFRSTAIVSAFYPEGLIVQWPYSPESQ